MIFIQLSHQEELIRGRIFIQLRMIIIPLESHFHPAAV